MDIRINANQNIDKAQFEQTPPNVQPQGAKAERPVLSITHAPVSADDSMDLDVPDAAIARDDKFGRLVSSAFSLPAPPMPKFD